MQRRIMEMLGSKFLDFRMNPGKRTTTFSGLTPNTVYYFKIFGYRGAGTTIGYKTDGDIQQISLQAK